MTGMIIFSFISIVILTIFCTYFLFKIDRLEKDNAKYKNEDKKNSLMFNIVIDPVRREWGRYFRTRINEPGMQRFTPPIRIYGDPEALRLLSNYLEVTRGYDSDLHKSEKRVIQLSEELETALVDRDKYKKLYVEEGQKRLELVDLMRKYEEPDEEA